MLELTVTLLHFATQLFAPYACYDSLHCPSGSCRSLAVIAYGIMVATALALPETKGRELTAEA
jgi:hypothetical protein